MKNKLMTIAGAAAVFLAVAQTTQATPITGNIGFSGTVTLDTGDVTTANDAVSWNATVGNDSGSFSPALIGLGVNLTGANGWTFTSGPIANFWQVGIYSFTLSSSTSSLSNLGGTEFLNAVLSGTVSDGVPADTTAFNGTFQVANPAADGVASFTERLSFNSVPDGGTTMMLLGGALMGLGLIKRKLS